MRKGSDDLVTQAQNIKAECDDLCCLIKRWISDVQNEPVFKGHKPSKRLQNGLERLESVIRSESSFFEKVLEHGNPTIANIKSSNLPHFRIVIQIIHQTNNVTSVFDTFKYKSNGASGSDTPSTNTRQVRADVVADNGMLWIKCITKKFHEFWPILSILVAENEESDGEDDGILNYVETDLGISWTPKRSVVAQLPFFKTVKALLHARNDNQVCYKTPKVGVVFQEDPANIVPKDNGSDEPIDTDVLMFANNTEALKAHIVDILEEMGVAVTFMKYKDLCDLKHHPAIHKSLDISSLTISDPFAGQKTFNAANAHKQPSQSECCSVATDTLLLDVTTLCALTSSLTHAFQQLPKPCIFDIKPLRLQTEQERDFPILPYLSGIFEGRSLVTTISSVERLFDIAYVVGGPDERLRCHTMFKGLSLWPVNGDDDGADKLMVGRLVRKYPTFLVDQDTARDKRLEVWKTWVDLASKTKGITTPDIRIIPDQPSERIVALYNQHNGVGQTQDRQNSAHSPNKTIASNTGQRLFTLLHRDVFGTTDSHKWTLVTANAKTARLVLKHQSLQGISIITHPPRSLAEVRMLGMEVGKRAKQNNMTNLEPHEPFEDKNSAHCLGGMAIPAKD
ncbi:hypothetical protein H4219_001513 [Mycoemilia scoparia]|uniref:DUF1308 domain-containing protein n=1 Tax=Mycoemilia scoparia TaxID=417184 RepID=A0A9W8A7Z4_9FUNG|nr:hypothetical protein H4219_001513 [Mycoemilia scoparia]